MLSREDNELMCRVGPESPGGQWLRRFWMPALLSSQLPEADGDPIEVRLLGEDLIAFRDTNEQIGLISALCPHRQAPLFYGRNEECGLRCIYHGWKFDVNGECVDMPSEPPESVYKDKVSATSYPTREWAGIVWTYMGPPELMPELPGLEWGRVAESHRFVTKYRHNGNWVQAMEGDADSSHVGFLHGGKLRSSLEAVRDLASKESTYVMRDKAPRWLVEPTDYGMLLGACRDAEADSYYWRINQWLFPFYTFIAGPLDQKRGHCHIWVPIDDEWTDTFDIIWSTAEEPLTERERDNMVGGPTAHIASLDPKTGYLKATVENHFLIDRHAQRTESFSGIRGTREQDTAVTTGMGPIVDRTKEHLGSSDTAIIAMRRVLLKGIKDLMNGEEPYAAQHPDALRVRSWSSVLPRANDFFTDPEVKRLTATMVP